VSEIKVTLFHIIALFAGKFVFINPPSIFKAVEVGTILCVELSAGNLISSTDLLDRQFITNHLDDHRKPSNDFELGHWLAGLIEGEGSFGERRLEIVFHEKDISLAYSLRSLLGYGLIYKIKDKRAFKFVIRKKAGLSRVIDLCNGKFVGPFKVDQLHKYRYDLLLGTNILPSTGIVDPTTHWLAGFLDADGSLGIFVVNSPTHKLGKSVRLEIKISQKERFLLDKIQSVFGGSISFIASENRYKYKATGMIKIRGFINYLDQYHLQSRKYLQFFILRRAFRLMEHKEHLTLLGLNKIFSYKERLQNVYK
jgi:LAGLIDADG endonuclease